MSEQTLILIRGLPGSGKSSLAELFDGPCFAADDYFMVGGTYRFDAAQLGRAHKQCQANVVEALAVGQPITIVANTFSMRRELKPYLSMAEEFGARVHVIDLFDAGLSDAQLAERGVHDVPVETIARFRARWHHSLQKGGGDA